MRYIALAIVSVIAVSAQAKEISIPAVTIVPVANLATEPMDKRFPNPFPYEKLPATYKNHYTECPRLHQALFNEHVRIVKQDGNHVLVEMPSHYLQTTPHGKKINRYWSDKRYFLPLTRIPSPSQCIPKPIDFNNPSSIDQDGIITLTKPFYHCPTNKSYSTGTRFLAHPHPIYGQCAIIYDPKTRKTHHAPVPATFGCSKTIPKNQRQKKFVELLQQWIHEDYGNIPYVFGGCSNNFHYPALNYTTENHSYKDKVHTNYVLKGKYPPCDTGFDCTGLVLRAAQIAQIPYFFKNTTTLGFHLRDLTKQQMVEDGDLILIPGHVIVVSDVNKGKAIEARTIRDDYGQIQEVPISELFEGINNYNDLQHAHHHRAKLHRLNKKREVIGTFPIRILKMNSAWQ